MKQEDIGTAILKALTTEQAAMLLDAVFSSISPRQTEGFLAGLPADIGRTVAAILDGGTKSAGQPARQVSDAKLLELWQLLWDEWDNCVSELGDEEGRYAYQDRHWEPACFDSAALAADLDKIAEKLLPLLQTIHQDGSVELDVFATAIDAVEDGIDGFPDWMQGDEMEVSFGPTVTRCLLEWEKLHAEVIEIDENQEDYNWRKYVLASKILGSETILAKTGTRGNCSRKRSNARSNTSISQKKRNGKCLL